MGLPPKYSSSKLSKRVLELVIDNGGSYALSDIAIDLIVSWEAPYDDAFNGIRKAVNQKLANEGFALKLQRHDGHAQLVKIGQK